MLDKTLQVEEDYREKNAREGRAIYIKGKTTKEIQHEKEKEATMQNATIQMSEADVQKFSTALEGVVYSFSNASAVFALLQRGVEGGYFGEDDPGVIAICEIASKFFLTEAEQTDTVFTDLGRRLKEAVQQQPS